MSFLGFIEWIKDAFNRLICTFLRHPSWTILEPQPLTDKERQAFEEAGFEAVPVDHAIAICNRCGMTVKQECQE